MNSTQQNEVNGGTPLAEPTGSRIERIMDELLDIEYHSGCSARVKDMVHRAINYLESAKHAANTKA